MTSELQCKFENYGRNMAVNFKKALQNGDHSDVTVVCDDNKQFKLHKVILAACSDTFKKIFCSNPSTTTVFLRGVQSEPFMKIITFM